MSLAVEHRLHICKYRRGVDDDKVKILENNLRDIDLLEMMEMSKYDDDGEKANRIDIDPDYEHYFLLNDEDYPIGIFGISKAKMMFGKCIYCLMSKELDREIGYKKSFVELSKEVIPTWIDEGVPLFNFIHKDNKKSKLWLKSFGAVFRNDINLGDMILFQIKPQRKGE